MKKIVVYWRDIPAQVIVKRGRKSGRAQLSQRFQAAIDRAAMRAGKGSSNAYLEEWRREYLPCEESGDPAAIAEAEAQRLEAAFSDERLEELIRARGGAAVVAGGTAAGGADAENDNRSGSGEGQ